MRNFKLIRAALLCCFCLHHYLSGAQSKGVDNSCNDVVTSARRALMRGQLDEVDKIYEGFINSDCQKDKKALGEIYRVMSNRMARSENWVESDAYEKKILDLNGGKKNSGYGDYYEVPAHQFIGLEARYGKRLDGGDLHIAGLRYGHYNENGGGFEIGAAYQQFTTVIKETDNKDANGRYVSNGYYFQGATRTDAWTLSGSVGWSNTYPEELFWNIKGSFGVQGGVEAMFLNNTKVKTFYKEVVVTDTEVAVSETLSQHNLSFNVVDRSDYYDNTFFKSNIMARIYFGPQYRFQLNNVILGITTHFMSSTLPRFKVKGFDNVYAPGAYFTYGIHLAWVFRKDE